MTKMEPVNPLLYWCQHLICQPVKIMNHMLPNYLYFIISMEWTQYIWWKNSWCYNFQVVFSCSSVLFLVLKNITELFFVTLRKHFLEVSITPSLYMKNKHYFKFNFVVEVLFKGRIKCTKSELLDQFQKSFTDFNQMAQELQKFKEDNNSSLKQVNVRIIKCSSILKGDVN